MKNFSELCYGQIKKGAGIKENGKYDVKTKKYKLQKDTKREREDRRDS